MNGTFYKTQMELAEALMRIIDVYYAKKTTEAEAEAVEQIKELSKKNDDLLFVGGQYGAIIVHRLGKKRMRVLRGALEDTVAE